MFEAAVVEVESAQSCDRCHLGLSRVTFVVSQYVMNEQAETMAMNKVRSDINLMYELLEKMIPGRGGWKAQSFIKESGL